MIAAPTPSRALTEYSSQFVGHRNETMNALYHREVKEFIKGKINKKNRHLSSIEGRGEQKLFKISPTTGERMKRKYEK